MRRFIAKLINILFCLFSAFMIVRSDFYVKKYESKAKEAAETAHYAAGIAMRAASKASADTDFTLSNRRPGKLYSDQETKVHAIGIYKPQGAVMVNVEEKRYPVILVLMAYEETKWLINAPNHNVVAIVLGGYHSQSIIGIQGIPIHAYTYLPSNCQCYQGKDHFYFYNLKAKQSFVNTVYAATGKIPMTFQTSYSGKGFNISAATPELDISDLKYIPH